MEVIANREESAKVIDQTAKLPEGKAPRAWTDRAVWVAVAIALILRLALAAHVGLSNAPAPGTDQQEYDTYAWNMAQGRGYRGMSPDVSDQDHLTAYRPPGPSLLFAGIYAIAGHRYEAARIVNCVLAALCVYMVYRIGRRVFDERVGILAAAGYAIYPVAIMQSIDLVSEPLGILLFLLFLEAALVCAKAPSWAAAALTGALLGLALLSRANYVVLVPLLGLWIIWQFKFSWSSLAKGMAILVVAAIVIAPWGIRNYSVFGKVIPFSTMGGSVLLQGNNRLVVTDPKLFGYSVWDTEIPEYRAALQSAGDEYERDELAKRLAVDWIKSNRDKWGFLVWHKFVRSWTPILSNNPSAIHRLVYMVSWGPVLLLFCIAAPITLVQMLKRHDGGWLLHLAVLHYVINSVVFFANIRYRSPIDPICFLLAAWTVMQIYTVVLGRDSLHSSANPSLASNLP